MKPTVKECFDGSKFNEYWCSECGGYIIDSTMGSAAKLKVCKHCGAEIEWPTEPVEVPGILFIAPANVIISERTYKDLKIELRRLKDDVKCCEIEEIRPLVRHIGAGKLDASKHLLEHIETIERLLGFDDEK